MNHLLPVVFVGLLDDLIDALRGLLVLLWADVHVEIDEREEGVGHSAHLASVHAHNRTVEDGVLLVSVDEELGGEGQRHVQEALAVPLSEDGAYLLMHGEEPVDVDEGGDDDLSADALVARCEELDELAHLNFTNQVLSVGEN